MRFGSRGGGFRGGFGGGHRGGFGGGGSFEKPVKEGEEYDVEINEVGSKGDGIAKIKNFVIFVPGTKKGEKVKIRITQVKAKSAVAEVVGGGSPATATEAAEPAEGAGEVETAEEVIEEETEDE
ncbi:TRAM domain-containing protein [Candidatus Micrarchaeota archaeon]|nr:TRAM domain-containing protein [Candidatus Micrarchaeota archaeon]